MNPAGRAGAIGALGAWPPDADGRRKAHDGSPPARLNGPFNRNRPVYWRLATGDWRLATGDWRLAAGGWRLAETEGLWASIVDCDRRPATDFRRLVAR
ncbi:hypothetical protein GCM10010428_62180 [Actinosynnema pretiosum subsp. pretiosum]